jgi:Holliday junction resolvasome RuvABC endonuclease subunit
MASMKQMHLVALIWAKCILEISNAQMASLILRLLDALTSALSSFSADIVQVPDIFATYNAGHNTPILSLDIIASFRLRSIE